MRGSIVVSIGVFFCLFSSGLSEGSDRLVEHTKKHQITFVSQGWKNILCDHDHLSINRQYHFFLPHALRHRYRFGDLFGQEEEILQI